MDVRRIVKAVALAAGASGCFGDLEDYSTENVRLTTQVTDWRDEVIYQLLVDRFADGDTGNDLRVNRSALGRYQGGDWQGVIDHIDYLERLGVTAIWISPIVRNVDTDAGFDAYHGYWAQDLAMLNPHFGDLATLRRMVRVAHEHHIKVVLDIVTNHLGQMFYYDINNNGQPDESVYGQGRQPDGQRYQNPNATDSTIQHITEYDPDYTLNGPVQAFTSLGPAGDAPIVFLNNPSIFRVPPRWDVLQSQSILARPEGYHRRGRIVRYDNCPDPAFADACRRDPTGVGCPDALVLDLCRGVPDHQPNQQVLLGDFPGGLKDVATELPQVRTAMFEAYYRWVRLLDLDGFRIDTLKHVEHGFWQDFAPRVRQAAAREGKRNFLMFGEAFDGDDALVGSFTAPNEMDSVFYFPQKWMIYHDIFQCGYGNTRNVQTLYEMRQRNYSALPQPGGIGVPPVQALVNFMDNHDVGRFLFGVYDVVPCPGGVVNPHDPASVERMRQHLHAALAYLLTEDGIPCIYYGTEQDLAGGNDPSNRERLWDRRTPFDTAERRGDGSPTTFGWIRQLTTARRTYAALRRGTFRPVFTTDHTGSEPDAGMLAFERVDGDQYALVVIHARDGNGTAEIPMLGQPAGTQLRNVLPGNPATVPVGDGSRATVALGAWQAAVFVPMSQYRP